MFGRSRVYAAPRRHHVAFSLSVAMLLATGGVVRATSPSSVSTSSIPAIVRPASMGAAASLAMAVTTPVFAAPEASIPIATVPAATIPATTTTSAPAGVVRWETQTLMGVAYASASPTETLDLFLPVSDGTIAVPLVVLIHGGGFVFGDSRAEDAYVPILLQRGVAVASVNYRLASEALYPAGAQDVKAAVRWLRAHAAEFGLDPGAFGAWGQSAGGWMAAMLGATGDQVTIFDDPSLGNADESAAVQAVASWYPVIDFTTVDAQAAAGAACERWTPASDVRSFESVWLGQSVVTSPWAASTNVTQYLAGADTLPTWYVAHGDADCIVPFGQSAELAVALAAVGAPATYVVLPGVGHAEPAFDLAQVQPTVEFLVAALAAVGD